ncbi:hypothetical protein H257_09140 [Aphanomyces astaci]|uniref:FACT complex subunit SSRP1 n=1 Tax=Aphanomyces astaci TaxID=112090 RepID=W4GBJ8_APHAT|nr:hypothetical protein H257_09140 [Aphanomyces astaci]ETV76651.1 hypothetical protein H257_09140 [Aphanomyces astaci]RQM27388.1 hypothetical protein B5M09_007595 [Aphanomyces astaci]|eukprot:XP_009833563.1 hypothetical protein H257_09140 [Aphanomyces astaci]
MDGDHFVCSACWGRSNGALVLSKTGLVWRSRQTEAQKKVAKDDIADMRWCAVGARHCHVKVTTKAGKAVVRFTELKVADVKAICKYVEDVWGHIVDEETLACSGHNWGQLAVQGDTLNFVAHNQRGGGGGVGVVVELPLGLIAQCALPSKTELEFQFHDDNTVAGDEEALVDMRVYVPAAATGGVTTLAERLKNEIVDRANIRHVTGNAIVELDDAKGTFVTPRGRYAIDLFASFMRLHGKTYDYKILYANISRCFLLQLPSSTNMAFVISLDEPIRQGKQRYPHLVLQLASTPEVHVDVKLPPQDLDAFNGSLHQRMTGALPQLVATLFKHVVGKKVFTSGSFLTHTRTRAVKCALKANSGLLFPLEKSLLFIHKPPTYIRYSDVETVEFQRYTGQSGSSLSRNFDLVVTTRPVGDDDEPHDIMFSAIDRREFPELSQFLTAKKLRILCTHQQVQSKEPLGRTRYSDEEESVDDDEDSDFFDARVNLDDDDGKHGKAKVKPHGRDVFKY